MNSLLDKEVSSTQIIQNVLTTNKAYSPLKFKSPKPDTCLIQFNTFKKSVSGCSKHFDEHTFYLLLFLPLDGVNFIIS